MSNLVCILTISCMFMVVWPEVRLYFKGGVDRIARDHTALSGRARIHICLSDSKALYITALLGRHDAKQTLSIKAE